MVDDGFAVVMGMPESRSDAIKGICLAAAVAEISVDCECLAVIDERFRIASKTLVDVAHVVEYDRLSLAVVYVYGQHLRLLVAAQRVVIQTEVQLHVGDVVEGLGFS